MLNKLAQLITTRSYPVVIALYCSTLCCGCGSSTPASNPEQVATTNTTAAPYVPPAASIEVARQQAPTTPLQQTAELNSQPGSEKSTSVSNLDQGTPEWMVREMTRLRTAPTNLVMELNPQDGSQQKVELNAEQAEKERLRRQFVIIDLSQQVIAKTHDVPEKQAFFNNAVHYLADARMQLVLAGEQDQAQLMQEDANALYQRDASSFAAVEAAFKLVQLSQTQSQRFSGEDPQWAKGFAHQSRLFAERFPQESSRASVNLIAAGRMCDNLGLYEEAKQCLQLVEQKFPDTPFVDQVAGMLRRLQLPGQELIEFGGSTHDGGFLSIDQYRGKTVVIAFWASNSAFFKRDLPTIQRATEKYPDKVAVIGVSMDTDEVAMDQFLEQTGTPWKHIFYSDPEKRGARNLVAKHYGVAKVPTYWIVDPDGIVRSINVEAAQIDQAIAEKVK